MDNSLVTLRIVLTDTTRRILTPPLNVPLSKWSDENIVLGLTSAEPGPFRTDRAPYQREILDTCGDPRISKVVLMTSSQIGKTSVILNLAAYFMLHDPCPMMIVEPSKAMAENLSTSKLEPILQESPTLRKLVQSKRKRDGGNKILSKVFPGGSIFLVGAQSAASLRSLSIRVLLADEIDAYPPEIENEGDPLRLALARTATFANRKIILCSTPTIKDFSRIEKEYLGSDQRVFQIPCPHCGVYQELKWGGREYNWGMKWDDTSVYYQCEACHDPIDESHKLQMLLHGQWIATNPDGKYPGFHVSSIYSPWVSWKELRDEWQEIHDLPDKRQSFVNLKLGEAYEDTTNKIETAELASHCHQYDAPCPTGVGVIVAGVDVQDAWLEVGVWGYGKSEQMWLIDTAQLVGSSTEDAVWDDLAHYLKTTFKTVKGGDVRITRTAIDSGDNTEMVMRQVQRLRQSGLDVHPIKGFDGGRQLFEWSRYKRPGKPKRGDIGVSQAKTILYSRLKGVHSIGPGYISFPASIHPDVLEQINSERKVTIYGKGNAPKTIWKKIKERNEQLDTMVYAYGIFHSLSTRILQDLDGLIAKVEALEGPTDGTSSNIITPEQPPARPNRFTGLKKRGSLGKKNWL